MKIRLKLKQKKLLKFIILVYILVVIIHSAVNGVRSCWNNLQLLMLSSCSAKLRTQSLCSCRQYYLFRRIARPVDVNIEAACNVVLNPAIKKIRSVQVWGARGDTVSWSTTLKSGRSRVRFPMVSSEFFNDIIRPAAIWPWGRLRLWEKSLAGIFTWGWGGKGGRCVRMTTLPPSCADFLEIWEPQTPGTLRSCADL